jgi:hypothetical protein
MTSLQYLSNTSTFHDATPFADLPKRRRSLKIGIEGAMAIVVVDSKAKTIRGGNNKKKQK